MLLIAKDERFLTPAPTRCPRTANSQGVQVPYVRVSGGEEIRLTSEIFT